MRVRLNRPVDTLELRTLDAYGAACGADVRTRGLCPRVRLKRPVDTLELRTLDAAELEVDRENRVGPDVASVHSRPRAGCVDRSHELLRAQLGTMLVIEGSRRDALA